MENSGFVKIILKCFILVCKKSHVADSGNYKISNFLRTSISMHVPSHKRDSSWVNEPSCPVHGASHLWPTLLLPSLPAAPHQYFSRKRPWFPNALQAAAPPSPSWRDSCVMLLVPGTWVAGVKMVLFYLMVLCVRHWAGFGGAVLLLHVTSVEVTW